MAAVYVSNLVINSGATFSQKFDLVNTTTSGPLDLTGYSVEAQIRKWAGSNTKIDFNTSIEDATGGVVKIELDATQTSAIKSGRYLYDILVTDTNSMKTRVVEGSVLIREGVTR
jgi:hypothetical protein